jgi:hypothetical protein
MSYPSSPTHASGELSGECCVQRGLERSGKLI